LPQKDVKIIDRRKKIGFLHLCVFILALLLSIFYRSWNIKRSIEITDVRFYHEDMPVFGKVYVIKGKVKNKTKKTKYFILVKGILYDKYGKKIEQAQTIAVDESYSPMDLYLEMMKPKKIEKKRKHPNFIAEIHEKFHEKTYLKPNKTLHFKIPFIGVKEYVREYKVEIVGFKSLWKKK
jgi:hypothetical protein